MTIGFQTQAPQKNQPDLDILKPRRLCYRITSIASHRLVLDLTAPDPRRDTFLTVKIPYKIHVDVYCPLPATQ